MPFASGSISHKVHGSRLRFLGRGVSFITRVKHTPRTADQEKKELRRSRLKTFKNTSREIRNSLRAEGYEVPKEYQPEGSEFDKIDNGRMDVDSADHGWEDDDGNGEADSETDIVHELREEYEEELSAQKKIDSRNRRDRVRIQSEAWAKHFPQMLEAFLAWDAGQSTLTFTNIESPPHHPPIRTFNLYDICEHSYPIHEDEPFTVTLIRYGVFPASPTHPEIAFSMKLLGFFTALTSRSPGLSIQAFTKALCTLGNLDYQPTICRQFSSTYGAYLNVLRLVSERISRALGRDGPDYGMRNACAPCTYKLKDESTMEFAMQIAIDGNNSLKRVERVKREKDGNGKVFIRGNIEREDGKTFSDPMFLSEDSVDRFKHETRKESSGIIQTMPGDEDKVTPCVETWRNLAADTTKKMAGYFRETGVFIAACRHGNCLAICDMIRSGELAKYPLSVVDRLIDLYSDKLLISYDIGCGFSKTANTSTLLAAKVQKAALSFCVGSFHRHAHSRPCQLDWHSLYISGAGLEDLETCERVFSSSNALARCTRLATTFRRKELITRFFYTWNLDKYVECSRFLVNNYRQALKIIEIYPLQLAEIKEAMKIDSDRVFEEWRRDEKTYLSTVKEEPLVIQIKINYLYTLQKLADALYDFKRQSNAFLGLDPTIFALPTATQNIASQTTRIENERIKSMDSLITLQKAAEDYETQLGIPRNGRWTPEHPEWIQTSRLLNHREFQKACDRLEGVVIARCFELTKANQSGLGYKLRTHIAKAIRSRSQAVKNAIKEYNKRAAEVFPPRPPLGMDEVLEYAQIGHFTFLKDSRFDIVNQPWAQRAGREAMDAYFKLQRAHEEITRVQIEASRLLTYIEEEESFLRAHIKRLLSEDSTLAYQVQQSLALLSSINGRHRIHLRTLMSLDGYSGKISIGDPVDQTCHNVLDLYENLGTGFETSGSTSGSDMESEGCDEKNEDINLTMDALSIID